MASIPKVAIFLPSLNRPHRLEQLIANIHATTPEPHRIYFVISDDESEGILKRLKERYWRDDGGTWIERNNFLLKHTKEPYMFLASDDNWFHSGWYSAALQIMESVNGVVPVNDLHNPNGTSFLLSRDYTDTLGACADTPDVIAYPGYKHNFADTEIFNTAKARQRWAYAPDSIVEHLHWEAGKSDRDATYDRALEQLKADQELFTSRQQSGVW